MHGAYFALDFLAGTAGKILDLLTDVLVCLSTIHDADELTDESTHGRIRHRYLLITWPQLRVHTQSVTHKRGHQVYNLFQMEGEKKTTGGNNFRWRC